MRVVYSPRHRLHHPERELESSRFQDPWEHPGRAEIIRDALAADERFEIIAATEWGTEPIAAVHDPAMVEFLRTAWAEYQLTHEPTHDVVPDVFAMAALRDGMGPARPPASVSARLGWWCFETTTPLTETTFDAACSSVDVALTAASLVLEGDRFGYGLCRPPGHHAARSLYGGYCFFNNAAVAADHVVAATGERVTVLDVDYHHGNGTQQIFYERDDVQYVSLHGSPERAYPYLTGFVDETGAGRGAGTTFNVPLAVGVDNDQYVDLLGTACEEIDRFDPAVVVVSLGLDTFHGDPISDLGITADGFNRCGEVVASLGRPTVVLQEGGYAATELGDNVRNWLLGLDPG